jgi:hypothetical protein
MCTKTHFNFKYQRYQQVDSGPVVAFCSGIRGRGSGNKNQELGKRKQEIEIRKQEAGSRDQESEVRK